MMNVNTSKAVILVSTIMILIIGGIVLSSIFINSLPEDDGDSSPINPASLPFSQRWYFNASVDKTQYHHGENIILTINFTCLINHTMPYFTRYFGLQITSSLMERRILFKVFPKVLH